MKQRIQLRDGRKEAIIRLIGNGLTMKEIAGQLQIDKSVLYKHTKAILQEHNVHTHVGLFRKLLVEGMVTLNKEET